MHTRFTELVGCAVPIQLAAMPGVVTPELAIAVSEAGGLGMMSAMRQSPESLARLLESIREQTTKPIGVNFLMPFLNRECVMVAAAGARVVEFFYGEPDPGLVDIVHGGQALASWQIGSGAEAGAARRAGCDFIVVQGVEAGGNIRGTTGLLPLLADVLNIVDIPVLAAGGIATGRELAAVLAAGAAGARIGTRFLASTQSAAHPDYIAAIPKARAEDTVLTETFSATWPDAPHRVLRSCVAAANAIQDEIVGEIDVAGSKMAISRFGSAAPTRWTNGNVNAMAMYAGQSVTSITSIKAADQIIIDLLRESERLIRQATP